MRFRFTLLAVFFLLPSVLRAQSLNDLKGSGYDDFISELITGSPVQNVRLKREKCTCYFGNFNDRMLEIVYTKTEDFHYDPEKTTYECTKAKNMVMCFVQNCFPEENSTECSDVDPAKICPASCLAWENVKVRN